MSNEKKLISIRMDSKLHKKLKMITVENDTTLQDYIYKLIEKDIEQYEKKKEKDKYD